MSVVEFSISVQKLVQKNLIAQLRYRQKWNPIWRPQPT